MFYACNLYVESVVQHKSKVSIMTDCGMSFPNIRYCLIIYIWHYMREGDMPQFQGSEGAQF